MKWHLVSIRNGLGLRISGRVLVSREEKKMKGDDSGVPVQGEELRIIMLGLGKVS